MTDKYAADKHVKLDWKLVLMCLVLPLAYLATGPTIQQAFIAMWVWKFLFAVYIIYDTKKTI